MQETNLAEVGDITCSILHMVFTEKRPRSEKEARARGCSLESLAAAAICGMLTERFPNILAPETHAGKAAGTGGMPAERAPGRQP